MALLKNMEENIKLEIQFKNNNMLNINSTNEYESWIPFILEIITPEKSISINESLNAAMTVYEVKNFIQGVNNLLSDIQSNRNTIFTFCCSENYFEIKLEYIKEDNCFEVEFWISTGIYTDGLVYGYDEGYRFIVGSKQLSYYVISVEKDFNSIMDSLPL